MPVKLRALLSTWRRRDDRGAVGVTFGILLASGVLLGTLAIVVDVGRLYVERDDLQNGADSAALALARACAEGAPACASEADLRDLAARYANANAADSASGVDVVCGDVPGVLPSCGPQPGNLAGCVGEPPASQYVEVHVSTQLADGSTVLPAAFAQTLSGGDAGTTVGACARAAWGPSELTILAATISICEFNDATDNGQEFADPQSVSRNDERVIQFWEDAHLRCGGVGPGSPWQSAGPAGFLNGGGSECRIGVDGEGQVTGAYFDPFEPYELAPASCEARIRQALNDDEVIYLPVHDGLQFGPGGIATFRLVSVAPFRVTAFQFGAPPGTDPPTYDPYDHLVESWVPGSRFVFGPGAENGPCGTEAIRHRCLTGAFVGQPIPIETLTGDNRIRLVG